MRAFHLNSGSFAQFLAVVAVTATLVGCTSSKEPILAVEVCLKEATGIAAFKEELQAIAQSQAMSIADDSAAAENRIDAITTPDFRKQLGRPVVSMVVSRGGDIIAIVGSIDSPRDQVAVFFFDGSKAVDGNRFGDFVVNRLEQKWRVEVVPHGLGAQGMADCVST